MLASIIKSNPRVCVCVCVSRSVAGVLVSYVCARVCVRYRRSPVTRLQSISLAR